MWICDDDLLGFTRNNLVQIKQQPQLTDWVIHKPTELSNGLLTADHHNFTTPALNFCAWSLQSKHWIIVTTVSVIICPHFPPPIFFYFLIFFFSFLHFSQHFFCYLPIIFILISNTSWLTKSKEYLGRFGKFKKTFMWFSRFYVNVYQILSIFYPAYIIKWWTL